MVVSQNILHLSSSSTPSGWCSHHFSLLFNPFLQQSFQWTSLAIMSSLVLFLRQTVILANYMIYRFTLLSTQPTKREVIIIIIIIIIIIVIIIIIIMMMMMLAVRFVNCTGQVFWHSKILFLDFLLRYLLPVCY